MSKFKKAKKEGKQKMFLSYGFYYLFILFYFFKKGFT